MLRLGESHSPASLLTGSDALVHLPIESGPMGSGDWKLLASGGSLHSGPCDRSTRHCLDGSFNTVGDVLTGVLAEVDVLAGRADATGWCTCPMAGRDFQFQ